MSPKHYLKYFKCTKVKQSMLLRRAVSWRLRAIKYLSMTSRRLYLKSVHFFSWVCSSRYYLSISKNYYRFAFVVLIISSTVLCLVYYISSVSPPTFVVIANFGLSSSFFLIFSSSAPVLTTIFPKSGSSITYKISFFIFLLLTLPIAWVADRPYEGPYWVNVPGTGSPT